MIIQRVDFRKTLGDARGVKREGASKSKGLFYSKKKSKLLWSTVYKFDNSKTAKQNTTVIQLRLPFCLFPVFAMIVRTWKCIVPWEPRGERESSLLGAQDQDRRMQWGITRSSQSESAETLFVGAPARGMQMQGGGSGVDWRWSLLPDIDGLDALAVLAIGKSILPASFTRQAAPHSQTRQHHRETAGMQLGGVFCPF